MKRKSLLISIILTISILLAPTISRAQIYPVGGTSCEGNYQSKGEVSFQKTYQNFGSATERIYIEACIYPRGFEFSQIYPLSITKETCCPGNYWCDGGWLELDPGEQETVNFKPEAPGPDALDNCGPNDFWDGPGEYEVRGVSTDSCCVGPEADPNCQARAPYHWGNTLCYMTVSEQGEIPTPYWIKWLMNYWYVIVAGGLIIGGIIIWVKK